MERHFTATAYIVSKNRVLLIYHPKLSKWLPPGGHMEKNETPAECAIRESKEETGIEIEIVLQENIHIDRHNAKSLERPYLCLLENIPAYKETKAHQHIDFIFIAKPVGGKKNEDARWFSLEEVEHLQKEVDIFEETQETIRHILSQSFLQK